MKRRNRKKQKSWQLTNLLDRHYELSTCWIIFWYMISFLKNCTYIILATVIFLDIVLPLAKYVTSSIAFLETRFGLFSI